jgi:hypothetical protein
VAVEGGEEEILPLMSFSKEEDVLINQIKVKCLNVFINVQCPNSEEEELMS